MFIKKLVLAGLAVIMLFGCTQKAQKDTTVNTRLALSGKHVAVLVGEGVHDAETLLPIGYLVSNGAEATVIGVEPEEVKAYNSDMKIQIARSVKDVSVDEFDALVIPGGHSPAWLRKHESVVGFTREFFQTGKPVAAICHGPQVLIAAGVLKGKQATCYHGMSKEYEEAGVTYIDKEVVLDGNLITSRTPKDFPAFCGAIKKAMADS